MLSDNLHRLTCCVITRSDAVAERQRRDYAKALFNRATPGGLRMSDFPNVRDVVQHLDQLTTAVLKWTGKACTIAGSHEELPAIMQDILMQVFVVCKEEVRRCLDAPLDSLSTFLGDGEPVTLSGDDSMNLDTQYVLYQCLSSNYKELIRVDEEYTRKVADIIVQHCGQGAAQNLARSMLLGDSSFQVLMESYLLLFVEVRLPCRSASIDTVNLPSKSVTPV